MTLRLTCIACLFLLALPLRARLGEKDTELPVRYGQPLQYTSHSIVVEGRTVKLGTSIAFKHDGRSITADLIGDRCARLLYTKGGKWSEKDIAGLLDANRQEEHWKEQSQNPKVRREWVRPDGSTALWSANGLTFTGAAYHAARTKAEQDAKQAKQP